jgi:uncharacterized protein YndB with AHSA1/START domain
MPQLANASGETLCLRRSFPVSREKVFAAWTQLEQLERWMCKDVPTQNPRYTELDVRPGGRFAIEIPLPAGASYRGTGRFVEVKEPEKLVFTWSWERIPPKAGEPLQTDESLVTVELLERDGATDMIFAHERLTNADIRLDHEKGWIGCFNVLGAVLSTDN